MPRLACQALILCTLGGWVCLSSGWASERIGVWKRGEPARVYPDWMASVRWAEQAGMEVWTADIRPSGWGQGVLLTVVFRPQPGGFVRAIWRGPTESVTLSSDMGEGSPSVHQRSLFLDASRIDSGGQIWIEAKGSGLERVQLEWVDGVGWGPVPKGGFVQTGSGRLLRAAELYGDAYRPEAPENVDGIVETLLQAGPIPIQKRSVRLRVPLAEKVHYARLEFWAAGLGAEESILFSLNEGPFEELRPEVPRLEDPGYFHRPEEARTELAGWRQVVRFIPGLDLQPGINTFWFGFGGYPGGGEVMMRDLRLQTLFSPTEVAVTSSPMPLTPQTQTSAPFPSAANTGLSFRSEGVVLRP